MAELPTGTVTFLFTDVEGSTRQWESRPDAMRLAMSRHDRLIEGCVAENRGQLVRPRGEGDSRFAVFGRAVDALTAARDIAESFARETWPTPLPIRVRMALHTGEADLREGDYYGSAVNRCARLRSLAAGGQTLLSQASYELVQDDVPARIVLRDLGEHRLKDLTRPEHVYQVDVAGLPSDFSALKSLDALPNNLPLQLTSFVGREKELREVERLLGTTRLLTLTGSGGTGKTRLSLQAAADVLDDFSDGVWLVELAPLSDPLLVPQAAATALGLREQPGRPLLETIKDELQPKKLLLILDNCEHLIAASAQFADSLLRACRKVHLLASSREALGIAGEVAWPVPSLSLPDAGQAADPETLMQSEAVRLFMDRAAAVKPSFSLTPGNAAAVAQLVNRLDGIPLAIELAAARLRALSVEQIASRLDDRFRLLTGGSRTALPRQQTLRALIDWSYGLLSEPERLLFRRLSVFMGGWTLEAAQEICRDPENIADGLDEFQVLELMTHLVDKSLVVAQAEELPENAGAEMRYRMLETIRQYAREKLIESGEGERLRDAHLHYFTRLAEEGEEGQHGPGHLLWIRRLLEEQDNARAALDWGIETDVLSAMRMIGALAIFWAARAFAVEGLRRAAQALAADRASPSPDRETSTWKRARGRTLAAMGGCDMALGDLPGAHRSFLASVEIFREIDDRPLFAYTLGMLGLVEMFLGQFDRAQQDCLESVRIARQINDGFPLALSLGTLGQIWLRTGQDKDKARAYLQESYEISRAMGNPWGSGMAIIGLGYIAVEEGDFALARSRHQESLRIFREERNYRFVNVARSALADVARMEGNRSEAIRLYVETARAWIGLDNQGAIARCLECLAFIAQSQPGADGLARAARLYGAAEKLRETSGNEMTALERGGYQDYLSDLRAHLEPGALQSAWNDGRAMSLEQVLEDAAGLEASR